MPLGASFLKWWWRSTISISAASPSARAASPASRISRLTARLRLGEIKSGIVSAARSSTRRCSGSNPVVPTTRGIPRAQTLLGQGERAGRQREVDHDVGGPIERARKRHTQHPHPGQRAGVRAEPGMIAAVERRRQPERRIGLDQLDQPGPHPPGCPMNADSKNTVRHGRKAPCPGTLTRPDAPSHPGQPAPPATTMIILPAGDHHRNGPRKRTKRNVLPKNTCKLVRMD